MKMMKKIGLLVLAVAAGMAAQAQIALGLELSREVFIQYEPVFVQVTMRNDSGQTLVFGESPELSGQLNFELIDPNGRTQQIPADVQNPLQGTVLADGETKQIVVRLQPYFDLTRIGTYRIYAWVGHRRIKGEFKSPDRTFEVAPGYLVWSRTVGVSDLTAQGEPEPGKNERTYEIRMLQAGTRRLLFLKISDDTRIYALLPLGKAIGEERVRCDTDRFGRLHVLAPLSPKVFEYFRILATGEVEENRIYRTTTTIPSLVRDPQTGIIEVAGGDEATLGVDYTEALPEQNEFLQPERPEL